MFQILRLNLRWDKILRGWSKVGEYGMCSVAVKCVDITQNAKGEGSILGLY